MSGPLITIARFQFRELTSRLLVRGWTVAVVVASISTASFGLRVQRDVGLPGVAAAVDGLVVALLLLPTLLVLVLAAGSLTGARERGTLALLATQPVRRTTLVTATFLAVASVGAVVVSAGVGAAVVLLAVVIDLPGLAALAALTSSALAAACIAAGLGVLASLLLPDRLQATVLAVGIWFLMALGLDLLLVVLGATTGLGPAGLLAGVMANPFEAARILTLWSTGSQRATLGPLATYLETTFGNGGGTALLLATLAVWGVAPPVVARSLIRRRDL